MYSRRARPPPCGSLFRAPLDTALYARNAHWVCFLALDSKLVTGMHRDNRYVLYPTDDRRRTAVEVVDPSDTLLSTIGSETMRDRVTLDDLNTTVGYNALIGR